MAINSMSQAPTRHAARISTTSTFVVPENTSRLFVCVTGSQGNQSGGARGPARSTTGYVNVVPGGTAIVTIGASPNTNAANGSVGGTTSFDGAISVTGSGNSSHGRYGPETGPTGTAESITSLPIGAPSGAAVRVTGATSTTQDRGNNLSGVVDIYL
jgi:hypothetical protein